MTLVSALAISIGVLGGIATFLVLGPLAMLQLQIWAIFIAWGCFFHCGGKEAGLQSAITNNVFGVVIGWIALLLVTHIPLAGTIGLPVWAGICVGVLLIVLVLGANVPAFSVIPATVYGFAAAAAFALVGNHLDALTSLSMTNTLFGVGISMIVGAIIGYISEKVAGALASPSPQKA